jgi:hypothetical protein
MLDLFPVRSLRTPRGVLLALSLGLWSCAASAAEPPQTAGSLHATDTTCPWGRLGDGKGRLVRCLTQTEAERLLAESPPAPGAVSAPPTAAGSAPTVQRFPALSGVAPADQPPVPPDAPAPSPALPPSGAPAEEEFLAEIGAVTADQGTLPEAAKSLKKARDRFVECVQKNGGLTADRGEVDVRFMVQGRGRAEGVSVKKRRGMSEVAAKCVADVVDRRYVGAPEEPMVGATLQVVISKKKR